MARQITTLKAWSNFILGLAVSDPAYTYGLRKCVSNAQFQITSIDKTISLNNVGFKANGSKLTMLKKYYTNEQSIEEAKISLKKIQEKGDIGSVAFSTIGEKKKFTHHQHCIQSIAIRHEPTGELKYTVFYRAVEPIKIFTGDMVFIRDIIMPQFGNGSITFFFANANLNAMYCPLMFIMDEESWKASLGLIKNIDSNFFNRFYKWTKMYFSEDPINYSSAEVIRTHIHKHLNKKTRKSILNEFKDR